MGNGLDLVRLAAGPDRRLPGLRDQPEAQERYGYPAITTEAKDLILGGNAARLYGV